MRQLLVTLVGAGRAGTVTDIDDGLCNDVLGL